MNETAEPCVMFLTRALTNINMSEIKLDKYFGHHIRWQGDKHHQLPYFRRVFKRFPLNYINSFLPVCTNLNRLKYLLFP